MLKFQHSPGFSRITWIHIVDARPRVTPPLRGQPKPPGADEDGWKDTVQALPKTVTRICATFDKIGQWVWHCHILSHEDHEMMRCFEVV